jgi:TET-Associated Glycosyltransferase
MTVPLLPTYPVYVPSKGRADTCYTAKFLVRDGVPFQLVVEPQEHDLYAERYGAERVLVLPHRDRGLHVTRCWIKDHATATGAVRHWQLDDNIRQLVRVYRGSRIRCAAGPALAITEQFVDRYENVAIAGLNYEMFHNPLKYDFPPFWLNVHVYSCTLILNSLPHRWRRILNDDTDICLQVLADGWCTVLMNAFLADKIASMVVKGGNTDFVYKLDGRTKMARSLQRDWPHVVHVRRRFRRAQHVVRGLWRGFDTQLKMKPEFVGKQWDANEFGMLLMPKAPKRRHVINP